MPISKSKKYLKILVPIFIGIVLLFIPLLGDFHIESALLVSLVGCFWAGIRACNKDQPQDDFYSALRVSGYLYLVGFPLLIKAIFTGCFSIDGLAFWVIFPLPSVFFGYAIGRLLRIWNLPFRRMITVAILLAVGVGIFLYELLNYPQVYFFNHVWGAWPGPIYDEVIRASGTAIFFRSLTVLWAVLLWHIPLLYKDQYAKWIVGFATIAIALSYTNLTEFGVISPRSHLQKVLGGHKTTEHFELYYDRDLYSDYEINLLATEHEFYLDQISDQLELPQRDSTDKIESYLYAHPWQKKQLVGAKFTSYVPVWLEQDQLHIAKQQIQSSLKHELVHVLAKQFGNDLFNASWSTGLIEGIAVAIDGGSSTTSTIDQIVVSEKPYPTAEELQQAFSPWGFYGGRAGVNYITSGSFVSFLMRNYPVESLKEAYRTGNIGRAYAENWEVLTQNWHQHLDSIQVDTLDRQVASRIFGIPSLFEQECPHVVSDFAIAFDNYQFRLANRDTSRALDFLDQAVAEADSAAPIKAEWSYQHLVNGHSRKVQQAASLKDTMVDLQLLYADAFAMSEEWGHTQQHITKAQKLFAQNPDSLLEPALVTRMDRQQWEIYRQMTYNNELPDPTTFSEAYYRTKVRSLPKAIDQERWDLVGIYAGQLSKIPLHDRYFDDYLQLIRHLSFRGNVELAHGLMEKVSAMPLRDRYRERLQQDREWLEFL
jgi:hypothetical protein